jgi:hypothetical protein
MADTALRDRLHRHVDMLASLIGERNTRRPGALEATRTYLQRTLAEAGPSVVEQAYDVPGRVAMNLEVVRVGRRPELPQLVIGAHYDTAWGTPGADDNASAVAALLEIVAAHARNARAPRRTVRYVLYDTEEPPHFGNDMGSQFHAASLRRAGLPLLGMICLESIGYYRPAQPQVRHWSRWLLRAAGRKAVFCVSDLRSTLFLARFGLLMALAGEWRMASLPLPRSIDEIGLSDHRGYWEQGYRALMVTDTAFLKNPHYHQPTDTADKLDFDRLASLVRHLTRATRWMAGG